MKYTKKILHRFYYQMLRIRMIEEKISELYAEKEMRCPVHLSVGQEAIAVGVAHNLRKKDKILSAHRSHAHYLAKNGDLKKMLAELYGKNTGCAKGRGGSMHLIDLPNGFFAVVPIVGSTVAIAVGLSLSNVKQSLNDLVTVFFGDGATEEGVFFESIDFAILKNLPMLFICENNFYSVYSNLSVRQSSKRVIHKMVKSHGMTTFSGDGNDVVEVDYLVNKALDIIKIKKKPVFLELFTYRWLEHCGPNRDDDLNYRNKEELKKWLRKCPIKKLEKKMLNDKKINQKLILHYKKSIIREINIAFSFAKKSKFPVKKDLFKYVYK